MQPPGAARYLDVKREGPGWVSIEWKKPTGGGPVAYYQIQVRHHGKRVKQVVTHHFGRIADRGEVERAVPFRKQREVAHELGFGAARQLEAELAHSALQRRLWSHVVSWSAARNPRLRCTSSSEIAAGVTPEIRAAWPMV